MEHLEEGTIHAWLDGALSEEESGDVERHVAECATCAAAVAEARGFIAASSRILSALDGVPSGVVPLPAMSDGVGSPAGDDLSAARARRQARVAGTARRRTWWRHPGFVAAAAAAFVAVGSFPILQRWGAERSASTASIPASVVADSLPALGVQAMEAARAPADAVNQAPGVSQPPSSPSLAEGTALRRKKESSAPANDAASPAPTPVLTEATRGDAAKGLTEMKIGPVVPLPRASALIDTAATRQSLERESRQRPSLGAVTTTGSAVAARGAGARDSATNRRFAAAPQAKAAEADSERDKARSEQQENVVSAGPLVGCFAIRLVAVGGGPMAIAAVRLPTHVALDGIRIVGVADVQYEARDISPASERVPGTFSWRPTGSASFDFLIMRDGGTQSIAAVTGENPTMADGPVTPMPAGSPVRLAATRERCR
ncbi:MAG: zf-HC2 domain-containing protein [Gemmatimonadaceae bacterium]